MVLLTKQFASNIVDPTFVNAALSIANASSTWANLVGTGLWFFGVQRL